MTDRPTPERLAEIRQANHYLPADSLNEAGEAVRELLAEIAALVAERDQLRGVIESQRHVGNEENRLAAQVVTLREAWLVWGALFRDNPVALRALCGQLFFHRCI